MADQSNRIGGSSSGSTQSYAGVSQSAEYAATRAGTAAQKESGTPGGGKGRVERVNTATPATGKLDRSAPRGSYLNIVV